MSYGITPPKKSKLADPVTVHPDGIISASIDGSDVSIQKFNVVTHSSGVSLLQLAS